MKKNSKIISFFICLMILCTALTSTAFATEMPAATEQHYIDIEIPDQPLSGSRPEVSMARASSPLSKACPTFNAFIPQLETAAYSNLALLDFRDNSIPVTAKITNVTFTSSRTSVPGMTYYVCIGRPTDYGDDWAPDLLWNSTVNTSWFNGEDPWGYWGVDIFVKRVITYPDYGAAGTVTGGTLRIYYTP